MKKCRFCQTISAVPQESEVEYAVCRLCGSLEFVDISEEELRFTMKRLARLERCCPNPACEPRLLANDDNYCSKCGRATEKTSLALWIQKCVEPVFIVDPARIFTEPESFIEMARKLGFAGESSTAKFEEIVREWTGRPSGVTADWISLIREKIEAFPADFYAGKRPSKKMYRASRNRETVVALVLGLCANSRLQTGERRIIFTPDFNGQYIGFYNNADRKQLWIYPVSGLEFSECDFSAVFPDLTREAYETRSFEPRKAFAIGDGNPELWSLSSIRKARKRLIPALIAVADEKGLEAELTGKILESFFR